MNKLFILPITLGVFVLAMTVAFAQVAQGQPLPNQQDVSAGLLDEIDIVLSTNNVNYGPQREGEMGTHQQFTITSGSNVDVTVSARLNTGDEIFEYINYEHFQSGSPVTILRDDGSLTGPGVNLGMIPLGTEQTVNTWIDLTGVIPGALPHGASFSGQVEYLFVLG